MMIHIKTRTLRRCGLLLGCLILGGLALTGALALLDRPEAASPVMRWNPEDVTVREPAISLPVEPEANIIGTVLSSGILEEIMQSDKLLAEYRMERQRLRG